MDKEPKIAVAETIISAAAVWHVPGRRCPTPPAEVCTPFRNRVARAIHFTQAQCAMDVLPLCYGCVLFQ